MLREMGEKLAPRPTVEPSRERRELAELNDRRRQLVDDRKRERQRLQQTDNPIVAKDIKALIRVLDNHIASIETRIRALLEARETLGEDARRMQTAPGIGAITAAVLLAEMPEIGHLSRRAIAMLAGLAPIACESGDYRERRKIQGGRRKVRTALYMAALGCVRASARFRAFYERLRNERGLAPKAAFVAVARKLLTVLNAMLCDGVDYCEHRFPHFGDEKGATKSSPGAADRSPSPIRLATGERSAAEGVMASIPLVGG